MKVHYNLPAWCVLSLVAKKNLFFGAISGNLPSGSGRDRRNAAQCVENHSSLTFSQCLGCCMLTTPTLSNLTRRRLAVGVPAPRNLE